MGKIGIYEVYLLLQMDDSILKNILTKIGEVNPKYDLEKQVYNNGELIQFIDNPSEEMKQAAMVQKDPSSIKHIQNPSERVQLAAVKKFGSSIKYIQNPSETVQLEAVKKNPYSIYHIENPSEKVQLAAVEKDPYSIQFIQNPSEKVKQLTRSKGYDI